MSSRSRNNNQSGFTLLEVMIAMAILVFLAFGIYQATVETYKLREVLSTEGDFYNEIRLSMNILQRDIALIYSPVLVAPPKTQTGPGNPATGGTPPAPNTGANTGSNPVADAREMQAILSSDLGHTTQFWGAATDKTGIRPMHFIGSDSKMSFVAVSHIRVYKDSPESEFAKIVYELRPDKNADVPDTSVLMKLESPNAFETDEHKDKSFAEYPLLHGVKKISFSYYYRRAGDKDMTRVTSWDSDKEDFKNIYPEIIEVKVEVLGPSKLSFDGLFRFRPEVPLNGLDPST